MVDWFRKKMGVECYKTDYIGFLQQFTWSREPWKDASLRAAVNYLWLGKGVLFGTVSSYGKGHQYDVASPQRRTDLMYTRSKSLPWTPACHSPKLSSGMPSSSELLPGALICHWQVPVLLLRNICFHSGQATLHPFICWGSQSSWSFLGLFPVGDFTLSWPIIL